MSNINNQKIVSESLENVLTSIIDNSAKSIRSIFDKQLKLYLDVYVPRLQKQHSFSEYEFFTYIDKQNVLSIINELWELEKQYEYKIDSIDDYLEMAFEIADLYHFVYQGIIIQYQKLHQISRGIKEKQDSLVTYDELTKWIETDDSLLQELFFVEQNMVQNEWEHRVHHQDNVSPAKITHDQFIKQSEILNYVDWKHWKTYDNTISENNTNDILGIYYDLLIILGGILGQTGINTNELITFYNIKEEVNRERQKNNY